MREVADELIESKGTPVPVAPGRLPLLGHAFPLFTSPLRFLTSLKETGKLVRIDIGDLPMLMITDAALTKQVLTDSQTFDKGGALYDKVLELTGESLLTSKSEPHRKQRRLMQPAFSQARIKEYSSTMGMVIDAVLGEWENGDIVDMTAATYQITSRTAAKTMFAAEFAAPAIQNIVGALSIYLQGLFLRMMAPTDAIASLPTPGNIRYRNAVKLLHESVDEIITAYRVQKVDHGDLLSMLLASDDDGAVLTDEEVHNQVITLFLAGIETTAAALAWALCLLGSHPNVAAKLHAEVDLVLCGRAAQWADIPQLPETRRIITEALRLYPPGWIFTRVTMKDVRLGSHMLPTGTGLAYSPYLLHRDPEAFHNPDVFDPARWLPDRVSSIPRDAFVPFGGGVHKCIGDQFGLTEAVMALATIASRWSIAPTTSDQVEPAPRRATLTPGPTPMRITRRVRGVAEWLAQV